MRPPCPLLCTSPGCCQTRSCKLQRALHCNILSSFSKYEDRWCQCVGVIGQCFWLLLASKVGIHSLSVWRYFGCIETQEGLCHGVRFFLAHVLLCLHCHTCFSTVLFLSARDTALIIIKVIYIFFQSWRYFKKNIRFILPNSLHAAILWGLQQPRGTFHALVKEVSTSVKMDIYTTVYIFMLTYIHINKWTTNTTNVHMNPWGRFIYTIRLKEIEGKGHLFSTKIAVRQFFL